MKEKYSAKRHAKVCPLFSKSTAGRTEICASCLRKNANWNQYCLSTVLEEWIRFQI